MERREGAIRSFRDEEAQELLLTGRTRIYTSFSRVAIRRLQELDFATSLADLGKSPGNRLEALSGNRKGQHSIRINQQYRICFAWRDGGAYDVEIVDYH